MTGRAWWRSLAVASAAAAILTIAAVPGRAASPHHTRPQDEAARTLAERYAPFVRLQEDSSDCADGEQFQPTDVEAVLGDQQVALRGPWRPPDLVKTQPEGEDIGLGFPGHSLDFPGDPLRPGCTYAEWSARINRQFPITVYAHVASDPEHPGQISLQYWFFYVFNDYNNTHEGDWESIQLVFDASTPAAALRTTPTAVGYSQHGGSERALWGDDKLEIVDRTHPVVYPAAGSHANKYGQHLYLGRGSEGLGCDDTTTPRDGEIADIAFVPTARADYVEAYPWLAFEGRWGERQRSVFDGPTGPNMKRSWRAPIQVAVESWRDDSTTVPAVELLGPNSSDVFCSVVATGSNAVRETLDQPWLLGLVLVGLVSLIWFAASRTRWRDADPLPARRRRGWGQAGVSALLMFGRRPTVFAGLALLFVLLGLLTTSLAWLHLRRRDSPLDLGAPTQEATGFWVALIALVVTILTVTVLVAMLAALTWTVDQMDGGRTVTATAALSHVGSIWSPLAVVAVRYYLVLVTLTFFTATIPLAVYYAVSRAFAIPAVAAEGRTGGAALKRSRDLVRGHWWRTAGALAIFVGLGVAAGPIVGIALLLGTDVGPALINLASSLVFAAAMPFAALAVAYLYFDRVAAVDAARNTDARSDQPAVRS